MRGTRKSHFWALAMPRVIRVRLSTVSIVFLNLKHGSGSFEYKYDVGKATLAYVVFEA